MATTRREFLRASVVTGLASAATLPALKALAAQAPSAAKYQHPKDPKHMTGLEMAHWPKLRIARKTAAKQPFDLMIQIGHETHPMTPEHHIEWAEVWAGGQRLERIEFTNPVWEQPVLTVRLVANAATELKVRLSCNLHGLWENSIKLQPGQASQSL